MVIYVHVYLVSTVLNVNLIIDVVNQILVKIKVLDIKLKLKYILLFFFIGTCNTTLNSTSLCICTTGWEGIYCEKKINFCLNITCINSGICEPLFLNYTCRCLSGYSGRYCEITITKIVIYKIVSKSFSYIAIVALISVVVFIVIMDILKYGFGIDPVREERERIRRKKLEKNRKPVVRRFIYTNASPQQSS